MNATTLLAILVAIIGAWQIQFIAASIAADVLTGIAAAIKTGSFDFRRIADFLGTNVLPFLLCYAAVYLLCMAEPSWQPVSLAVWALIEAALAGSIVTNLREVFGDSIPVPGLRPRG